jgi:integrase
MATYRKRGNRWSAEVCVNGVREASTHSTKAAAQMWARDRELELRDPGYAIKNKTAADVFDRYAREVSPGKGGTRWELLRLAAFEADPVGKVPLTELNASHIAQWRDRRLKSVKSSTVNREWNLMSAAFSVARKEWLWLRENPMQNVKRPKDPEPRDRRILNDEIDRICLALGFDGVGPVESVQQRCAVAFLFAIETAMRAGEICSLRRDLVEGRVAHLPKTKNGTSRRVPLSTRAIELLGMLPDLDESCFGLTARQLDVNFRKGRDRSGIENLVFHDTRHEATTRLAKVFSVLELARVTGHKDLKKLMIYFNETAENLAEQLD